MYDSQVDPFKSQASVTQQNLLPAVHVAELSSWPVKYLKLQQTEILHQSERFDRWGFLAPHQFHFILSFLDNLPTISVSHGGK